jgi:hypothetical protein
MEEGRGEKEATEKKEERRQKRDGSKKMGRVTQRRQVTR